MPPPEPQRVDSNADVCSICLEEFIIGEVIARLQCLHMYCEECLEEYKNALVVRGSASRYRCPYCRAPPGQTERWVYGYDEYQSAEGSNASQTSVQARPWWPYAYHSVTQLEDGRVSWIVDPGAWTNLIGSTLARKAAIRAKAAGHTPTQERMEETM